MIAIIFVFN